MENRITRIHRFLLLLWFPVLILLLILLFNVGHQLLHTIAVRIFLITTPILYVLSYKTLWEMASKPEFWLVIFSLGIAFCGGEFMLRQMPDPTFQNLLLLDNLTELDALRYVPHHYSLYTMNPNWRGRVDDNINSLGFRGEEIEIPKPNNTYRIVAIGGSTTYGESVPRWQEAYPAQLQQILNEEYGFENIEVINAGQPGYNSWETLINLEFRVLDLDPDMIILYQNTNDVHARIVPPENYHGDNSGRRMIWDYEQQQLSQQWSLRIPSVMVRLIGVTTGLIKIPSTFIDAYVIQTCTGQLADVDCLGIEPSAALEANPPIYYERNLRSIIGIAQINNIDVLFVSWAYTTLHDDYAARDYYETAFAEHNVIMRQVASEEGILFYDFAADMPTDIQFWADGRHMTVEGNRLRAELIAEFLVSLNVLSDATR